jgi:hypothetical protein
MAYSQTRDGILPMMFSQFAGEFIILQSISDDNLHDLFLHFDLSISKMEKSK